MTAPTDTLVESFVENAQRTQEAVAGAVTGVVRTWVDALQGLTSGRPSVPDAQVVVDRWFDVAQTVLDTQKAFAKSVVGAGVHAAEIYTEQAQKAADTVAGQTENVVSEATKAAPVVSEATKAAPVVSEATKAAPVTNERVPAPTAPAVRAPRNAVKKD